LGSAFDLSVEEVELASPSERAADRVRRRRLRAAALRYLLGVFLLGSAAIPM